MVTVLVWRWVFGNGSCDVCGSRCGVFLIGGYVAGFCGFWGWDGDGGAGLVSLRSRVLSLQNKISDESLVSGVC